MAFRIIVVGTHRQQARIGRAVLLYSSSSLRYSWIVALTSLIAQMFKPLLGQTGGLFGCGISQLQSLYHNRTQNNAENLN
jgi:hypothetical protein